MDDSYTYEFKEPEFPDTDDYDEDFWEDEK